MDVHIAQVVCVLLLVMYDLSAKSTIWSCTGGFNEVKFNRMTSSSNGLEVRYLERRYIDDGVPLYYLSLLNPQQNVSVVRHINFSKISAL